MGSSTPSTPPTRSCGACRDLGRRVGRLEERLEERDREIGRVPAGGEALTTQVATQRERLQAMEATLSGLRADMADLTNTMTGVGSTVKTWGAVLGVLITIAEVWAALH